MDFDRIADLHYAFQFGQEFAETGDSAIAEEFARTFVGDTEAQAEYDKGVAYEMARHEKLGSHGTTKTSANGHVLELSHEAADAFFGMLENPPSPAPLLVDALKRHRERKSTPGLQA